MNEQDEQAFKKWCESIVTIRAPLISAWQAAIEYERERSKKLVELLELASEKLALYRSQHSGEYIGGVEYQGLQNSIEKSLKEHRGEK